MPFPCLVSSSSSSDVEASLIGNDGMKRDTFDVKVECFSEGSYSIEFAIGNKPSSTLLYPKNVSS